MTFPIGEPVTIAPNIYQVGGSRESHEADAAVFLVDGGAAAALIDAGTGRGGDRVLANIRAAGVDPARVSHLFLTHCHYDHTGGANALRQATGGLVAAHEAGVEFLEGGDSEVTAASWYGTWMEPTKIDIAVTGSGAAFDIGSLTLRFIHAPGHSPDSSVLTVKTGGTLVLFGQDVHGPLHDSLRSVRRDYENSLRLLISLEADILCEGHFGVYTGRDRVRAYIESFL